MRLVRDIVLMMLLVIVQAYFFNRFFFFGYLNPYPYLFLVFSLMLRYSREGQLLLAFALGASLDLLEGTGGVHAAATTFIAFIAPLLLRFFSTGRQDSGEELSIYSISLDRRLLLLFIAFTVHHFILFSLENFGFDNFGILVQRTLFSSLFSFTFVLLYQLWNSRR
jgi:rod shape-determining protein MreD